MTRDVTDDSSTPPPHGAPPQWASPPWSPQTQVDDSEGQIDLMEYFHLVWRRRQLVFIVVAVVVALSAAWAMTRPKIYRSTAKLTLQPALQPSSSQFENALNWYQLDRIIADQVQILMTRNLAERVARRLGAPNVEAGAVGLLGAFSVEPIRDTFVIQASMVGRNPERCSEYLNIYIEEYVKANIEDSIERTRKVYDVIQSRLDPLRQQVVDSEQALMTFQERDDAVLLADQDHNVITEQVGTLTAEYAAAKAERIRLETKINALQHLHAENLSTAGFPEILSNPTIQRLKSERNQLEVDLADKLRSLKEGHPDIQDMRSRLAGLDQQIRQQIDTVRSSMQTDYDIVSRREQRLYASIQELREQSIELSKQTLEYGRLKREYDQSKSFLEDMLARSKEADIASTSPVNNIRVIEPARPPNRPFSPNVPRSIAVAIAFGLLLGIGMVIGADFIDQTIRTPDDVERHLSLDTLTALPTLAEDNANLLREAFQTARTALMLAARGDGCHIVQVTSAIPAEGKTTVAVNLAKVMAAGGSRVLLVDADLRKPRVHRLIGAKNVRGLTSVVLGEHRLADVLHPFPDLPSMAILTSGPLPPNPPEVFGKESFHRILAQARQQYDWVVIDTPPVASVTDPVICARAADMVLLVVQYGGAKRPVIRESVRMLGRTGTRIAGVALNKVDIKRDSYYYMSSYSYYSRYGHSYYSRYGHYGDAPSQTPPPTTPA